MFIIPLYTYLRSITIYLAARQHNPSSPTLPLLHLSSSSLTTDTPLQADKLQSLITAAKVPDIEPIWTTLFAKALEGKDVKELLLNVGSGGGAAPAAAGGAPVAGGDAAADAPAEAAKEEGKFRDSADLGKRGGIMGSKLTVCYREGRVRRGHGLRSFRLSGSPSYEIYLDQRWECFRLMLCGGMRRRDGIAKGTQRSRQGTHYDYYEEWQGVVGWKGESLCRVVRFNAQALRCYGTTALFDNRAQAAFARRFLEHFHSVSDA